MSIQRVPNVPFAQIANSALRDRRLSFKARGILALVLSNIGEWEATTDWVVNQSEKDGDHAVQTGLNELTTLGYRRVKYEKEPGVDRIRTVTEWFHEPLISCPPENLPSRDSAGLKTGAALEHYQQEHYLKEQDKDIQATQAELLAPIQLPALLEKMPEKRSNSEFEAFWKAYPRKTGKGAAEKAFAKAVKEGTSSQVLIAAALIYRNSPDLPDNQFIPHPATWLNARRWEDEPMPERSGPLTNKTGGERRMDSYKTLYEVFAEEEQKGITYGE